MVLIERNRKILQHWGLAGISQKAGYFGQIEQDDGTPGSGWVNPLYAQNNFWRFTQEEYIGKTVRPKSRYKIGYPEEIAKLDHRSYVAEAVEAGMPVRDLVLRDYPEIKIQKSGRHRP